MKNHFAVEDINCGEKVPHHLFHQLWRDRACATVQFVGKDFIAEFENTVDDPVVGLLFFEDIEKTNKLRIVD